MFNTSITKLGDFITKLAEQRKEHKKNGNADLANNCKYAMNGIYGKTIEDVEKHVEVKMCKGEKQYIK